MKLFPGIQRLQDGHFLIPYGFTQKCAFTLSLYVRDDKGVVALYELQKDKNKMYRHYPFIATSLRFAPLTPTIKPQIVSKSPLTVRSGVYLVQDQLAARVLAYFAHTDVGSFATLEQSFVPPKANSNQRSTFAWLVAALITLNLLKIDLPPNRSRRE